MGKKIKRFGMSFVWAYRGIREAATERNFQIHGLIMFCVVIAGYYYQIKAWEWVAIFLASAIVFGFELINSAIERLADLMKFKLKLKYEDTTVIRDMAAGAVLISAFFATLVGLEIFVFRFF